MRNPHKDTQSSKLDFSTARITQVAAKASVLPRKDGAECSEVGAAAVKQGGPPKGVADLINPV